MMHLYYNMILEAEARVKVNLDVDVESYLVRMVEFNTLKTSITNTIITLELLQATTTYQYREVGDKSLLYDGMFYQRGVEYKQIGQTAYQSAADLSGEELYNKLSYDFDKLVKILRGLKLPLQ